MPVFMWYIISYYGRLFTPAKNNVYKDPKGVTYNNGYVIIQPYESWVGMRVSGEVTPMTTPVNNTIIKIRLVGRKLKVLWPIIQEFVTCLKNTWQKY